MPDLSIQTVATIVIPVADQDRALAFYTGVLGFAAFADFAYAGGERWIEVEPPGGHARLTLAAATDARPAGIETGIVLDCADLAATHAALLAAGVRVDEAIATRDAPGFRWAGAVMGGVPDMARVWDPDGNSLLLTQGPVD